MRAATVVARPLMAVERIIVQAVVVVTAPVVTQIAKRQASLVKAKNQMEHVKVPRYSTEFNNNAAATWVLPEGAIARLGRGKINAIAFSSDSECLAAATDIGLWWYELAIMQPVALSETERGMVSAISFSDTGSRFATGNADSIVKVWETQNQQCVLEVGQRVLNHGIRQLAFSPDGHYLAASRTRAPVSVWCAETGRSVREYHVEVPKAAGHIFYPICFSPDGTLLAYMSSNDTISVTHLETGVSIVDFSIHAARVKHLIFSPCGQFLAAGIQRKDTEPRGAVIYVWNIPKHELETSVEYSGHWATPTYLPDGSLRVAEVYEGEVAIWDTSQQEKRETFEHHGDMRAARFSPEGQQFAIASSRSFQVWRENAPQVVSLQGHLGHSNSVTFTQNGKTLVSGHSAGSGIVFWNVAEKRAQQPLLMDTELPVSINRTGLAVSPDEEFLAASYLKTIEVWHVVSRTRIMTFTESQFVGVLAFSLIGECFVSTTTDSALYMWDVNRWEKRDTLYRHTEHIRALAFHPDGKILVTASEDGTTGVWDVARGSFVTSLSLAWPLSTNVYKGDEKEIERVLKAAMSNSQKVRAGEIWSITFSACGTLLAGGMANEIRLWDAATYETLMVILPPRGCQRPFALAFSPCSRYLVSGSWWQFTDKVSIRLWDVTTGKNITTFWGHPTDVQDLAFSPDGTLLASGGYDGTILLWDMKPYL